MPTTYDLIKRLVRENGREFIPQYVLVVVCMMLVAGMTSLSAYVLKYVIDTIFVHQNRAALVGITIGIVTIFIAKGFAAYFSEVILGKIGSQLVARTQKRMFDHLMKVDMAFYQQVTSSELVTRMSHNANAVRDMLNMVSLNLGRDVLTIVGLIITMIVLDPIMAAIALIGGPIAAFSSRKMVARIKKATQSEVHSMSGIIQITREVSQGAQVVKSFQLENKMRKRMFDAIEAVQRVANKMLTIGAGVNPLMETIGGCAVAAVVFYAGWRNLYYGESPGQFFAFITALLMCADPARRVSRVQLNLATASVGVRMMYQLIDTPAREDEPPGKPSLQVTVGHVEVQDVSFRYSPNKPVINNMSFDVPAGKVTALVGHSGGGKSTLFALLQRLREPDSGVIKIDGQTIADVSLVSLRSQISVVGQDSFLFEGTIIDNIRAGLEGATDEQCIEAAKSASAHEFIMSLPRAYDSPVGELGGQVSGGQRQRIALARAYLKNAPIILLDEPTSALDSETEDAIQRELRNLTKGKTTLVIAHRLSTILHADLIHVIEGGRVIESGTHDQLIANAGAYNRLFKLQFAKYLESKPASLAQAV
ncbi:ABC transporter ATP-binding protein [Hyphomicrobium sp.]|uniref:ABC transporter ATP-binding protein n=1 Tax=Hyphomicrobium sp. TaxID=82 RepID=UPI002D76AB1C|nr:ABC transporter ATP-binding protein [Hyphomicrobium sp.]HET6389090.1 ABC transporter ATP-binding protein [Hyphomicrobium sp.]